MLGLPPALGILGGVLLVLGLAVALGSRLALGRRVPADPASRLLATAFALTLGLAPLFAWRIVEDIRYTSRLRGSDRTGAGPVQAFLQPYLLDAVPRIVPADGTYAAVAGPSVPYETAREAFPSLAVSALFPRISVDDPAEADWVVAWGVDPRRLVPASRVVVARPRSGVYPAVYVARVGR